MAEPFPYTSAQAFNTALTARIAMAAKTSPYNASQLRKQFAYDRLLARLFADPAGGWILKGGISMITRLPVARHTADVDLAAKDRTIQQALADLEARSGVDLGDFFSFEFGSAAHSRPRGRRRPSRGYGQHRFSAI